MLKVQNSQNLLHNILNDPQNHIQSLARIVHFTDNEEERVLYQYRLRDSVR